MSVANSGLSNAKTFSRPAPPVVLNYPATTEKNSAMIFGSRAGNDNIVVNGIRLLPEYLLNNAKWFANVSLTVGVNNVSVVAEDVTGTQSASAAVTITRVARTANRTVSRAFSVDGNDVTAYVQGEPSVSMDASSGVGSIDMTLTATMALLSFVDFDLPIVYTYSDGLISKSLNFLVSKIEEEFGEKGKKTLKITGLSSGKALKELTLDTTLAGKYNGQIVEEVCLAAGYTTVYAPIGQLYTGPRFLGKRKIGEIIENILFVECWQMQEIDSTTMAFFSDVAYNLSQWEFNDDEIRMLSRKRDTKDIINRARIKYSAPEDDFNVSANRDAGIPDKSTAAAGSAFYSSDSFFSEVTEISPDSVLFFAAWSSAIDWSMLEEAYLKISFSIDPMGESKYRKTIFLFEDAAKKIGTATFNLRTFHLTASTVIYYQYYVEDKDGNSIGSQTTWNTVKLVGAIAEFGTLKTAFDLQFSKEILLGTFDKTWLITTDEDFPASGEDGIVYSQRNGTNTTLGQKWDYEFIAELVYDDMVLSTLTFDFEQATSDPVDSVCLQNIKLETEGNSEINLNDAIYALALHEPSVPVARTDRVFFKFTGSCYRGDSITIKFSMWGRTFESLVDYEDYTKIFEEYEAADSVADYGLRDGGGVASSYLSTALQAESRIKKFVEARKQPAQFCTLELPPLVELQENQLIKMNSTIGGDVAYYWVIGSDLNIASSKADCLKVISVSVPRLGTDATMTRNHPPDIGTSLGDVLADLNPSKKGFRKAEVDSTKYRGMYSVIFENGEREKYIRSRIKNLKQGDRVLVAEMPEGDKIIVQLLQSSFIEDAQVAEEITTTPPTQEHPNGTVIKQEFKNYIKAVSIKPSRVDGEEVPIDVSWIIELSHDMDAGTKPQFYYGSFEQSLGNFLYVKQGSAVVLTTITKLSPKQFRVVPKASFIPAGGDITLGIENMTSSHPNWIVILGNRTMTSKDLTATLAEAIIMTWNIEPVFECSSVTQITHTEWKAIFTAAVDAASATTPDNWEIVN